MNIAIRRAFQAASILAVFVASACGDTPERSAADGSKWAASGAVVESEDSALFLMADSNSRPVFATLGVDGVSVGSASAPAGAKLIDAVRSGDGSWLALWSTCVEDSGAPCAAVAAFRVDTNLSDSEPVLLEDMAKQRIRALGGTLSGDFYLEAASDTSLAVGRINEGENHVEWLWKSPSFDLAAIRDNANESQDFSAALVPRIDSCQTGNSFLWRFSLGAEVRGLAVNSDSSEVSEIWVPSTVEAETFSCSNDLLASWQLSPDGTSINRRTWPLDGGKPVESQARDQTLSIDAQRSASKADRFGGGVIVEAYPEVEPGVDYDPTAALDSMVWFGAPAGAELELVAKGPTVGSPIVTNNGTLIGWRLADGAVEAS